MRRATGSVRRGTRYAVALALVASFVSEGVLAQDRAGGGGRGGGGGGRGRDAVRMMGVAVAGVADGAMMPAKYSQNGAELSPSISWSGAPDSTLSYVLLLHDLDTPVGNNDDLLHWMVWNIPGSRTSLPEGVKAEPQMADGSRQISATGPYYRGPATPATGIVHHYLLEVFALDAIVDVPAVGQSPQATRAAVVAAMTGHVRGKGTFFVKGPQRE